MSHVTTTRGRRQPARHDHAEERLEAFCWDHNAAQQVRATVVRLNGRWYCDIRKFVKDGPEHYFATAKGVSIPVEELGQLEVAVRQLRLTVEGLTR